MVVNIKLFLVKRIANDKVVGKYSSNLRAGSFTANESCVHKMRPTQRAQMKWEVKGPEKRKVDQDVGSE